MNIDTRMLECAARLTQCWDSLREDMYKWLCRNGDARWQKDEDGYLNHMYSEYFADGCPPITRQMYRLDDLNRQGVVRYINEYLNAGMAPGSMDIVEYPTVW